MDATPGGENAPADGEEEPRAFTDSSKNNIAPEAATASDRVSRRWCPVRPWTLSKVRAVLRGALDPDSPLHALHTTPDLLELIIRWALHIKIKAVLGNGGSTALIVPAWKSVYQVKAEHSQRFGQPACRLQLRNGCGAIPDSAILSEVELGNNFELLVNVAYADGDAPPCLKCSGPTNLFVGSFPDDWQYSTVYCVVCGLDIPPDSPECRSGYLYCAECKFARCQQCDAGGGQDLTCLLSAVYFGHEELFQIILSEGGYSVDMVDRDGKTLLARSAEFGHVSICRFLLAHGATLSIRDNLGNTPLSWAAFGGQEATCDLLLSASADVNEIREDDKATPLCVCSC